MYDRRTIAILAARNQVSYERSAQIFKQISTLLGQARDTVRETTLVALGFMGK